MKTFWIKNTEESKGTVKAQYVINTVNHWDYAETFNLTRYKFLPKSP